MAAVSQGSHRIRVTSTLNGEHLAVKYISRRVYLDKKNKAHWIKFNGIKHFVERSRRDGGFYTHLDIQTVKAHNGLPPMIAMALGMD